MINAFAALCRAGEDVRKQAEEINLMHFRNSAINKCMALGGIR